MMMMMNDTNTDTFTDILSAYQSQDGNTLNDACLAICSLAATAWFANKLCDKWLPINRYDDDEDSEVHCLDDEEEQEEEGEDTEDDVEGGQVDDEDDTEEDEDDEDYEEEEDDSDGYDEDDGEEEDDDDDDYEEGPVIDRYEKMLPKKLEQSIVPCVQSRIRFADVVKVREYELPTFRTMRPTQVQTNRNPRNKCPTRERLDSFVRFHLRNAHEVESIY